MTDQQESVPNEALEEENGELLPAREAMSVISPLGPELGGVSEPGVPPPHDSTDPPSNA